MREEPAIDRDETSHCNDCGGNTQMRIWLEFHGGRAGNELKNQRSEE